VTDASGHFAVEDLAEGRYLLTASGFAPVSEQVDVAPGQEAAVELTVEPPRPVAPSVQADPETAPLPVVR
jgi:hypothetical protein